MAQLRKKFKIKYPNKNIVKCNIYTTIDETGGNYLPLKIDNIKAYVVLGG